MSTIAFQSNSSWNFRLEQTFKNVWRTSVMTRWSAVEATELTSREKTKIIITRIGAKHWLLMASTISLQWRSRTLGREKLGLSPGQYRWRRPCNGTERDRKTGCRPLCTHLRIELDEHIDYRNGQKFLRPWWKDCECEKKTVLMDERLEIK